MSRLSELIRRYQYTRVVRGIVEYLETLDLPGSTKKAIAMAVVKALHKQTGGKWDKELERAISGAIEWVLAEIREAASDWNAQFVPGPAEPSEPEVGGSIYRALEKAPVPEQAELLERGFKSGDVVWTNGDSQLYTLWTVVPAGEFLASAGWAEYFVIGG